VARGKHTLDPAETRRPEALAWPAYRTAVMVGASALVLAALAALLADHAMVRFSHAYLTGYAYVLSIVLGGLFFVVVTHLFKGGWSVVVRRPAEILGASVPALAILFAPIVVFVIANNGSLYEWAQPYQQMNEAGGHAAATEGQAPAGSSHLQLAAAENEAGGEEAGHDGGEAHGGDQDHEGGHGLAHYVELKWPYLTNWFFMLRWVLYFAIWSAMGWWFWRQSVEQDTDRAPGRTWWMEKVSAPGALVFGLTLTFAAWDLLMTLDPLWYSTIFGVYYFAGCVLGAISTMVIAILGLKQFGFFRCVNEEHFHDLGKLLFAFVFFWGYIAFSQYMLYWYARIPEEVSWYDVHGFTTVPGQISGWSYLGIVLLVGHLLIPFAGLLSHKAKRNTSVLCFWAVWLLVVHWLDVIWLVMPEVTGRGLALGGVDWLLVVLCTVAVLGLTAGWVIRVAARHSLVPAGDPRLTESLAFENM